MAPPAHRASPIDKAIREPDEFHSLFCPYTEAADHYADYEFSIKFYPSLDRFVFREKRTPTDVGGVSKNAYDFSREEALRYLLQAIVTD